MMSANNGNRKFGIVSNAENRRAVPNAQIPGKIERPLDVRLPRSGRMAAASEQDSVAVNGAQKKVHVT